MPGKTRYQNRIELLQGTLDMLILQMLQWEPQHGKGISQAIPSSSGDVLTGSLYPALHRLEKQGWLKSEWKLTGSNQRAKYYCVTGAKQLADEHSRWTELVSAIAGVMNPAGSDEI